MNMKEKYLKKAELNMPKIYEKDVEKAFESAVLAKGEELVIDLGNHYVGYFSFFMDYVDRYIDAPVRLYIKFCETLEETEKDFSCYKEGLCRSWLQDETVNIDFPGEYKMPRRYAARYIKISVVAATEKLMLSGFRFTSVTSADVSRLEKITADSELEKIDSVSVNTLKNCMQRVFEDGPKRDRRLWAGDLRLEALTCYHTFKNLETIRRCLYLFAAASVNEKGFIPGYVYEYPRFVEGTWYLEDYALMFVISVCDYYIHTGDSETFMELYPAVKNQMEAMHRTLDEDGIVTVAEGCDVFIDWCRGLEKITSLCGIYIYALNGLSSVLKAISHPDAEIYSARCKNASAAAEKCLYNKEKREFVNKKDNYQRSVHSAVWMVLAGVVEGGEAYEVLEKALNNPESIKAFTPYMHHYITEAFVKLGKPEKAREYIIEYWGGMVKMGADTFYEVYVPGNPDFSPYGDSMVNSMCHAWSCTPAYFIRKYFCR